MESASKKIEIDYKKLPKKIVVTGVSVTRQVRVTSSPKPPIRRTIALDIQESLKHVKHLTNFDWSYSGSGPSQLAFGLLLLFLPPDQVQALYQTFKAVCISQMPNRTFTAVIKLRQIVRAMTGQHKKKYGITTFMRVKKARKINGIRIPDDKSDPTNPLILR